MLTHIKLGVSSRWSNAEPIPRYIVEKHLDSIVKFVNAVLEVSRDVFYCNFPLLSLKVCKARIRRVVNIVAGRSGSFRSFFDW